MIFDSTMSCLNSFDELEGDDKEFVMEIVANYHYRNGLKHPDGSMGEIKITPKQLRDLVTHLIKRGGFR